MVTVGNRHQGPFRCMVVLGDSIAYGMCAYEPQNEWAQVAAGLLRRFQDSELELLNRGLPAGVISPRCPGYEESAKPSLMERFERHGVALQPDLVVLAEGLNDMRSGMPVQDFVADLETIVTAFKDATEALVVLIGIYHQVHGRGVNDPVENPTWSRWDPEIARIYNEAVRLIAERNGALFVDAQNVLGGADWVLNPDCCHLNDLGHLLIGQALFQTIVTRCPGYGQRTQRLIREFDISIANTGGTDTDEEIQHLWNQAAARFGVEL